MISYSFERVVFVPGMATEHQYARAMRASTQVADSDLLF